VTASPPLPGITVDGLGAEDWLCLAYDDRVPYIVQETRLECFPPRVRPADAAGRRS